MRLWCEAGEDPTLICSTHLRARDVTAGACSSYARTVNIPRGLVTAVQNSAAAGGGLEACRPIWVPLGDQQQQAIGQQRMA